MQVSVRINVDQENFARIEELLQILADRAWSTSSASAWDS